MSWLTDVAGNVAQTAGGTLMGNLVNQIFAGRNARQNWKYQKKAADYSYQQDLDMWNRQNAYNTPASQMARLEQAGLNPAMMYGTGQGANVAREMPKYNNPDVHYEAPIINPLAIMGAYADLKVKNAQVQNIEAATKGKEIENLYLQDMLHNKIQLTKASTGSVEADWAKKDIENRILQEFNEPDKKPFHPESGFYRGTVLKLAELDKSQSDARRASAEADIADKNAALWRAFRDMTGSDAKASAITGMLGAIGGAIGTAGRLVFRKAPKTTFTRNYNKNYNDFYKVVKE